MSDDLDGNEAAGGGRKERPIPGYLHGRRFYAELFGQTPRTINRWIAIGREPGEGLPPDLPPLDEPAALADWWQRRMTHRVPAEILALQAPSAPVPAVSIVPPLPPGMEDLFNRSESVSPVTLGAMGMLGRLREAEGEAARKYKEAAGKEPPDPGQVEMRRRQWESIAETLRKMEKDASAIMTASGDVFPREETLAALSRIHGVLAQTWRLFARRMWPKIRGLPAEQADAIWQEETDIVFEKLAESGFNVPGS